MLPRNVEKLTLSERYDDPVIVLLGSPDMKPKRYSVAGQERQVHMKWQTNLERADFTRIFTLVYRIPLSRC